MTEEERAALHRQNAVSRVAAERARLASLAGDPAAAQAVKDAWQPRLDAAHDHQHKPCEALPVLPPVRPGWVARVPPDVQLPEHLK